MSWLPYARDALAAVGAAGPRTFAQLLADARARPCETLITHTDRYELAVSLVAAWSRGDPVALPPNLQPDTIRALSLSAEVNAGSREEEKREGSQPDPGTHVVTLYTSGSTGVPRAVPKTAGQLLGEARLQARLLGLQPGDVLMATVSPHHVYGLLFGVLVPLVSGAVMVRETTFDPKEIAAAAKRYGARVLVTVPAHLGVLASRIPAGLGVRIVSSGAPLGAAAWRALAAAGLAVREVYGATETGGIATRDVADAPWQPLPGVRVRADAAGTLELASPFAAGVDTWTRGDDRIALEGDGFRLLGRVDDVVKVGGKRVSLSDVVSLLRALPGVRDAAAVVRPSTDARGQRIAAVVVAPSWSREALRNALARRLDPAVVPRRIELVAAIPREPSGKLRHEEVMALLKAPRTVVPQSPVTRARRGDGVVDVHVPAGNAAFDGHFDGDPVFPGAALLHEVVVPAARDEWPELGRLLRLPRVKLRRPIRPDDELVLALTRDAAIVTFTATLRDAPCASGTLVFEVPT